MAKQARRALGESGNKHLEHNAGSVVIRKRVRLRTRERVAAYPGPTRYVSKGSTVQSPPTLSNATCRNQ
eukprot:5277531-Pleurochrysis_carterae.AAC.1